VLPQRLVVVMFPAEDGCLSRAAVEQRKGESSHRHDQDDGGKPPHPPKPSSRRPRGRLASECADVIRNFNVRRQLGKSIECPFGFSTLDYLHVNSFLLLTLSLDQIILASGWHP